MGRKRNQGKARKAAKAKAREEQTMEMVAARMQQMPCKHGADRLSLKEFSNCIKFTLSFAVKFYDEFGHQLSMRFSGARDATIDQFAEKCGVILPRWKW